MLIEKEDAVKAICEACYMYKYIGEHYKDCKYYPCDDVVALEAVPSVQVSGDLISRQDAIEELESAFYFNSEDCRTAIGCIKAIPSAEQVTGKLDSPCGSSVTGDSEERKEQKSKLESADATCATCADRAMCIMSAPDGNWKACKDYRPSAEADVYEDYEHATLVDIKEPLKVLVVRCKDCIHQDHCYQTVSHTKIHDGFQEHWSETIEWCSRGERKGGDSE